eukprot:Blabericola_migrator_1__10003@NODE_553_length_7646_cov_26_017417_g416_i0_p3_GENE_NODE_553_length_7646_cov_26_017417_g416_i0NODE_553_length_7646_cov_26_017417_g416_i0_p3_ORF_typecomplete_len270_score46_65Peptidase_C26/PF07722_13/1_5e53GATase/PF00117_28/1_2e12GATase_5/PF13507_6/0_014Arm/PF00514_23/0_068_NODE_553_length_7646_cov_26_017417_g416_i09391748
MNRPIIILTSRIADAVLDKDVPLPVRNDLCLSTYIDAVIQHGGLPVIVPCVESPELYESLIRSAHGVLLPGGCDVDPTSYKESKDPKCGTAYPMVDQTDLYVTRLSDELGIPVLGVCRGLQIMNVARDGTLHQDLGKELNEVHDKHNMDRKFLCHKLDIVAPHSQLAKALGGKTMVRSNSLHHQGIKTLGRNLIATARCSETKLIEAVEDPSRFFVGVQCHPEELWRETQEWSSLFAMFIAEARKQMKHRIKSISSEESTLAATDVGSP